MAITAIVARPGQGKSIYGVGEIERWLAKGYNVYTNIEIKDEKFIRQHEGKLHFIQSLEDIVKLRSGKIILDEVQAYLNSRNWDKLPIEFQVFLQQHRKRGLDIIGLTQSIKRADVVFRELVQFYFRIYKVFAFRIPYTRWAFGMFYLYEYDPDTMESQTALQSEKRLTYIPWFYFPAPATFRLYDTTQEYSPMSKIGQRIREEYVITEKKVEQKELIGRTVLEHIDKKRYPQAPAA